MSFLRGLFGGSISRHDFARLAADALTARGVPREHIAIDDDAFTLKHGEYTAFLSNLYDFYVAAPRAQRNGVIERWTGMIVADSQMQTPETFEAARTALRPMLRPMEQTWQPPFDTLRMVRRPFSDELALSLVIDFPDSVRVVPVSLIETWAIDEEAAWAAALHNLRAASADAWERIADGCYKATWNDGYDATRVVFPDLLRRTGVAGRPIVMIPERGVLLVTGDRERLPIEKFVEFGFMFYDDQPYRRSPRPFVLDGESLVPLELTPELRAPVDRRRCAWACAVANEQKARLEDSRPEYVFATLTSCANARGSWSRTLATCSPVPTLLPRADLIAFADPDRSTWRCFRWADVEAVPGTLQLDPSFEPARYRVDRFPDDARFNALEPLRIDLRRAIDSDALPDF